MKVHLALVSAVPLLFCSISLLFLLFPRPEIPYNKIGNLPRLSARRRAAPHDIGYLTQESMIFEKTDLKSKRPLLSPTQADLSSGAK